jgi:hypothetical protein
MPPAIMTLTAADRRRIPFTHRNRHPRSYAYENLLFTFMGFVVAALPGAIYLLIRGL